MWFIDCSCSCTRMTAFVTVSINLLRTPLPPSNCPGLVVGRKDKSIYHTVEEALCYLDARTEFWRQQKPMYTRKREKETKKYKPSPTKPQTRQYPFLGGGKEKKTKKFCVYTLILAMGIRLRWCFSCILNCSPQWLRWTIPSLCSSH